MFLFLIKFAKVEIEIQINYKSNSANKQVSFLRVFSVNSKRGESCFLVLKYQLKIKNFCKLKTQNVQHTKLVVETLINLCNSFWNFQLTEIVTKNAKKKEEKKMNLICRSAES